MSFFKLHDIFAERYQLAELMGEGSFAEVWRAKDQLADNAPVLLNIYIPEKGEGNKGLQQFKNEFDQFRDLSHPYLVKASHFDTAGPNAYMVIPYSSWGNPFSLQPKEGRGRTGSWNPPEEENNKDKVRKGFRPYLLAAAVLLLLLSGAFWVYQSQHMANPTEGLRQMAGSGSRDKDREVDEMLIAILEEELEDMTRRNDSLQTVLRQGQGFAREENTAQTSANSGLIGFSTNRKPASGQSSTHPKPTADTNKNETHTLSKELEKQLNKISRPGISGSDRQAWKEETMARFSETSIRIVDETEGTPKQYSAGIFLNLLMNVPHTVEVKEAKRDQQHKITELRLRMQAQM